MPKGLHAVNKFTEQAKLKGWNMKVNKEKGGPRRGGGRKPIEGTKPEMKSVKMSREHWEKARAIGEGNMAEGLRRALDAWRP